MKRICTPTGCVVPFFSETKNRVKEYNGKGFNCLTFILFLFNSYKSTCFVVFGYPLATQKTKNTYICKHKKKKRK